MIKRKVTQPLNELIGLTLLGVEDTYAGFWCDNNNFNLLFSDGVIIKVDANKAWFKKSWLEMKIVSSKCPNDSVDYQEKLKADDAFLRQAYDKLPTHVDFEGGDRNSVLIHKVFRGSYVADIKYTNAHLSKEGIEYQKLEIHFDNSQVLTLDTKRNWRSDCALVTADIRRLC